MLKLLKLLIATAVFIAVIYWVESTIGWQNVWSSWQNISYVHLLLLVLITFASYLLRAYRIYHLFGQKAHSYWTYLHINLLHNALNNLLPMRLGEASFPLMMKRYFNSPILESSGGLAWVRIIDLHWLISCLLIVACAQYSIAILGLLALWFVVPLCLYRLSNKTLLSLIPKRFHQHWQKLSATIPKGVAPLAIIYFQTMLIWSLKLLALTIVFLSFLSTPFFTALFAVVAADISSVLPIHGFAGTGTFEGAMIAAATPFVGYSNQLLLAAVNVHIYLLLTSMLGVPIALMLPTPNKK